MSVGIEWGVGAVGNRGGHLPPDFKDTCTQINTHARTHARTHTHAHTATAAGSFPYGDDGFVLIKVMIKIDIVVALEKVVNGEDR